jgi:hypothetical protein
MRRPAPARRLLTVVPAWRETRFAHTLSLPVCSNAALSEEVETLAREIAGPDANAEIQDLAHQVAEAQIDLRRVRYARHKLPSDALADPHYDNWREKWTVLRSLLRKNAPNLPVENLVAFLNSTPQGPRKFATILSQQAKQLLAMDRYERRASAIPAKVCHSSLRRDTPTAG